MKKILALPFAILLVAAACNSQPASTGTDQNNQSADQQQNQAALSKNADVSTALQNILTTQNLTNQASSLSMVDCTQVSDAQFMSLGNAIMGWIAGDDAHHVAIENKMGGKQAALTTSSNSMLGKIYLGCAQPSNANLTNMQKSGLLLALHSNANLGEYFTDLKGKTLYVFANDSAGKSACTGQCLTKWPPFFAKNAPTDISTFYIDLTTFKASGGTQLQWKGAPLYYFAADQKPGDISGQNVGNVWFVAQP